MSKDKKKKAKISVLKINTKKQLQISVNGVPFTLNVNKLIQLGILTGEYDFIDGDRFKIGNTHYVIRYDESDDSYMLYDCTNMEIYKTITGCKKLKNYLDEVGAIKTNE